MKLIQQKCTPGTKLKPLSQEQYYPFLKEVAGWKVVNSTRLEKEFSFRSFKVAMDFLNTLAKLAEKEQHHPDFHLYGWNNVNVSLSTHAVGGLSKNDFILAAKVERMMKK